MKIERRLRALLPPLKAAGVAIALACASHAAVAGVATATIGGAGRASAVVTGGGVLNLLDRFGSYETRATNGLVTQSSAPFFFDWANFTSTSQANPGGNVGQASNLVDGVGGGDDPYLPLDSTGVSATATTSTLRQSGLGPTTEASASATRSVNQFNLLDPFDLLNGIETPVAGGIDFIFEWSLLSSTAGADDSANALVTLNLDNPFDSAALGFLFEQISGSGARTGTFTYHMDLGAGDFGFLSMTAQANAISAIPEPATLMLVGTALAGVVFVRRRRPEAGAPAAA